jgi:hypothetical protein
VINIPTRFKRFQCGIKDEQLPRFESERVIVNRCADDGPGTKLLGSLPLIPEDGLVVLVDDDMEYDPRMIEWISRCTRETGSAGSFHVYQIKSRQTYSIGQGSDAFAIEGRHLKNLREYFQIAGRNMHVWLNDDLWISYCLHLLGVNIVSCKEYCRKHVAGYCEEDIFERVTTRDGLVDIGGRYSRWRSLYRGIRYLERKRPWLEASLGLTASSPGWKASDRILDLVDLIRR